MFLLSCYQTPIASLLDHYEFVPFAGLSSGAMFSKIPEVKLTGDLTSPDFDAVVVIAPSIGHVKHPELKKALNAVAGKTLSINIPSTGSCI